MKKHLSDLLKRLSQWLHPDENTIGTTKLWRVVDGPIFRHQLEDEFLVASGIGEDYSCMLLVQIEVDGELGFANFWYETEEEAMAIKQYFASNIEPLEVL